MPNDTDEKEHNDEHVCFDFKATGFEERARGDPDELDTRSLIVETDFNREAPLLSDDLSIAFPAPRRLNVFLAHPMTELNDEQFEHCEQTNSVIVKTLLQSIDPIFNIYDPGDGFDPNGDCTCVYEDDERMIFWADLLVANHVFKADGIGMLITPASSHGIPIVSVVPQGRDLGAMYVGLPGRIRQEFVYSSFDELGQMLAVAIGDVIRAVRTRSKQREMVNGLSEHCPGQQLCKCRISQGISLEELSMRTGLSPNALYRIEHDGNAFLRLPISMVWTIAQALEADASIGTSHMTMSMPDEDDKLNEDFVHSSLTNLIDHAFRVDDDAAYSQKEDMATIRSWEGYKAMILSIVTRETPRPGRQQSYLKVMDRADWQRSIEHYRLELL